ncbi:hypothetical protein MMC16_006753 [Acarospora aff. strigata]|nr:hypothetical protein [Acarospora aff. strigata]
MTHGERKVDYDMKHHPMDDTLRPKATAKRLVRFWETSSILVGNDSDDQEKLREVSDVDNPFLQPLRLEWEEFNPLDRRIYKIQKGARMEGNSLPHPWPEVASTLVKERLLTRKQLSAWGGVEALRERYERVRLRMITLFDAEEAPLNKEDFVVKYVEDYDVHDLQGSGTRYIRKAEVATAGRQAEVGHMSPNDGIADSDDGMVDIDDDGPFNTDACDGAEVSPQNYDSGWDANVQVHREEVFNMIDEAYGVAQPDTMDILLSDATDALLELIATHGDEANTQRDKIALDHVVEPSGGSGNIPNSFERTFVAFNSVEPVHPTSPELSPTYTRKLQGHEDPSQSVLEDGYTASSNTADEALKEGAMMGVMPGTEEVEVTKNSEQESVKETKIADFMKVLQRGELLHRSKETSLLGNLHGAVSDQRRKSFDAFGDHTYMKQQPTKTKQSERPFQVFEDAPDASSISKATISAKAISHDVDPPKENFHERNHRGIPTPSVQRLGDLGTRTQRPHRTHSTRSVARPSSTGTTLQGLQ